MIQFISTVSSVLTPSLTYRHKSTNDRLRFMFGSFLLYLVNFITVYVTLAKFSLLANAVLY